MYLVTIPAGSIKPVKDVVGRLVCLAYCALISVWKLRKVQATVKIRKQTANFTAFAQAHQYLNEL